MISYGAQLVPESSCTALIDLRRSLKDKLQFSVVPVAAGDPFVNVLEAAVGGQTGVEDLRGTLLGGLHKVGVRPAFRVLT
jgi:hypothetical protein